MPQPADFNDMLLVQRVERQKRIAQLKAKWQRREKFAKTDGGIMEIGDTGKGESWS